jgi:hypothetical protein
MTVILALFSLRAALGFEAIITDYLPNAPGLEENQA